MYASIILVFLYVSFCIDYIKYRSNGFPKPVTGYGSGHIQYIFRRLFFVAFFQIGYHRKNYQYNNSCLCFFTDPWCLRIEKWQHKNKFSEIQLSEVQVFFTYNFWNLRCHIELFRIWQKAFFDTTHRALVIRR